MVAWIQRISLKIVSLLYTYALEIWIGSYHQLWVAEALLRGQLRAFFRIRVRS